MKKKVLVCGATGFIGRNIAEALARGGKYEVSGTRLHSPAPRLPGVRIFKCDLTDRAAVSRAVKGVDIIVQAAAVTSGAGDIVNSPWLHVTDNAVMNSLLFRAAHEHGVGQLLFFSCSIMYGSSRRPVKEDDLDANAPLHPAYFGAGWTKVYLERMCQFYAGLGRTRYTVVRHSNVYGPHDKFDLRRSHVFGATVTKVMTAPPGGEIKVWGDGGEARDLLYVSDLVSFVEKALVRQRAPFGLFNAGAGRAVAVKDLVRRIIAASGRDLRIVFDRSGPSIRTRLCLDSSRAAARLGWKSRVGLEEGIRRTLRWYAAHRGELRL
ncbi:MAG: putative nucleoside-diphosphate-sugar epimerase [Elusimicrobia bacterium]|nr:MAG: putative nucleoside-diphosphate-sugar epimerase [Elusimicrobiota bacterium]KAF0153729.1 MAG: putative nucleoside-diphosphate-sugar epimerase [Elusimicrobiota bacterium]